MLISVVRDNSVKELRVYVDGELRNTTDYCAIIGLNQKGLENQGILA